MSRTFSQQAEVISIGMLRARLTAIQRVVRDYHRIRLQSN